MEMDDDDEELRRVIALSVAEAQRPARTQPDEADAEAQFQRDLQAALEASKACSNKASEDDSGEETIEEAPPAPKSTAMSARAQMEKERLERLKRRREGIAEPSAKASNFADMDMPQQKRPRVSPPDSSKPVTEASRPKASQSVQSANGMPKAKFVQVPAGSSSSNGSLPSDSTRFWDGELRQTANRLVDREKDNRPVFRLTEIIGPKAEVSFAILSSYSTDSNWVYDFFHPTTPVILVNQGDDGNTGLRELAPNFLLTKPFLKGGRGCMHIKLFLIFYKDGRLRVCVPTANLVDFDWRDIENSAWVQDIPPRETPIAHDPKASDFPGMLQRVLHRLHIPAALTWFSERESTFKLPIDTLSELRMCWDWSRVTAKLVPSLAGKHEGWEAVQRNGHPALMAAVSDLLNEYPGSLQQPMKMSLECQGSSIGTYSTQWLNEFICSARGRSARIWIDRPKSDRAKLPIPREIKILFPSLQTVKDSVLGMPGAGTMFCRKTQWDAQKFPKELFHDSNSKRGRVLMHSKMILALFNCTPSQSHSSNGNSYSVSMNRRRVEGEAEEDSTNEEDTGDVVQPQARPQTKGKGKSKAQNGSSEEQGGTKKKEKERRPLVGWLYVGSHNFTPSAWGTLSGSSTAPVLNLMNYELGVLVPLHSETEADTLVCWRRPARRYVQGVDRPWMQEEMRR